MAGELGRYDLQQPLDAAPLDAIRGHQRLDDRVREHFGNAGRAADVASDARTTRLVPASGAGETARGRMAPSAPAAT